MLFISKLDRHVMHPELAQPENTYDWIKCFAILRHWAEQIGEQKTELSLHRVCTSTLSQHNPHFFCVNYCYLRILFCALASDNC